MSYEDLEEQDLFLPEEMWGKIELESPVSRVSVLAVGLIGVSGCALMWLGDGRALTWLGAVLFVGFLAAFAFVAHLAVERQNHEVDRRLGQARKGGSSEEASSGDRKKGGTT